MCARTTKNTHWSSWVEPQATTPPSDDAVVYARRDPAWVHDMVPMFPIKALYGDFLGAAAPANACPHHGPIKTGSVFCCMECHQSGMDHHPALRRNPLVDPKPEPKPEAVKIKLNRRQRRARTAA